MRGGIQNISAFIPYWTGFGRSILQEVFFNEWIPLIENLSASLYKPTLSISFQKKIVENENISHFGGQLVTDQVSHNKAMRADIEMKVWKYP